MEFKTSHGNAFKISEGKYLEFEGKKVDIKKIWEIGDHLIAGDSRNDKQIKNFSWVLAVITFVIGVYLQFNPWKVWKNLYSSYDGRSLEEVTRIPDIVVWFVFLVSIVSAILFTKRVNQVNNIDYNKNDYPLSILVILVDNPDPMKRETERYELCKGNIVELREIRRTLLDKINEQKLL